MNFKEYLYEEQEITAYELNENNDILNEVLITFGNRPNFGQVVILAGGAGSGKGFVSDNLLGIEAKVFDVDQVKSQIIDPGTPTLNKKIMDKYGIDVTKLDLKNPDDVKMLHQINDEMGISKKKQALFFNNLSKDKRKLPNVIFDSTGKSEKKIQKLVDTALAAGYDRKNIHCVWVMNSAKTAIAQNKERPRRVPEDILLDTHTGVARTMHELMRNSRFQEFLDGYVYVVFNQRFVDSVLAFSDVEKEAGIFKQKKSRGMYVKTAEILELKRPGKKQISFEDVATRFIRKIKKYVPKGTDGEIKKAWGKF